MATATDDDTGDSAAKLELELRRGAIVLAVLSQLREPRYGYDLRQTLAERGMPIEEGTLYPLLRRLESQGILDSEWRTGDGPPRRFYVLNERGRRLYRRLQESWAGMTRTMNELLKP